MFQLCFKRLTSTIQIVMITLFAPFLRTLLLLSILGNALSVLGQSTIIEQATIGFASATNNPDFAYNGFISTLTSDHSTAPGLVQSPTIWSPKSRIATTGTPPAYPTNYVVISPNRSEEHTSELQSLRHLV